VLECAEAIGNKTVLGWLPATAIYFERRYALRCSSPQRLVDAPSPVV